MMEVRMIQSKLQLVRYRIILTNPPVNLPKGSNGVISLAEHGRGADLTLCDRSAGGYREYPITALYPVGQVKIMTAL
jgi:hypothetical protein